MPGRPVTARLARTVRAPARRAFAAFTGGRRLSAWFTTRALVDARPGGRYENADGDRGRFLAVEPPRRLEFIWDMRGGWSRALSPRRRPGAPAAPAATAAGCRAS